MAIRPINLGSGGTQDALLKQLMEQYGTQATPKVSGVGRILAPLRGIGSIVDAYYDARYQDKDAGILNVLKNYALNLGQGSGTLLTGRNYEQDQKMQGPSELLDKIAPGYKYSAIGGSALGRMAVDIVGGLLTDPTTYLSFGATSLADDVIRGGLTKAGLGKKTVEKLVPQLAGGTMDDVARTLNSMGKIGKTTGAQVADNLYVYVMQNVGKSTAKSGALKAFGKTITESPKVVRGVKAVVSPLGAGMDALGAASKKFTPSLRADLLDVFDPIQGAIEGGKGQQALDMLRFNREASSLGRSTLAKMRDAGFVKTYGEMTEEEAKAIPHLIEASRETIYEAGQVKGLMSRKEELLQALKEYAGTDTGEAGQLGEIWPDLQTQLGLFDGDLGVPETTTEGLLSANKRLDNFYESLSEDQQSLISPLLNKIDEIPDRKFTDRELNNLINKTLGTAKGKTDTLLSVPEGITKNQKKFLTQYFDFERGITKKMAEAGLPTIDPRDMGYLMRNPKGYRENALKSTLKRQGMGDTYEKIMKDKRVLRDLEEGFVKRETLQKVLNENEWAAFKEYDPGMLGELIFGGGAKEERLYRTRRQAEKAGIVYGDNTLLDIYDQTLRQDEQLLAVNFAQNMVADKTAFSDTAKGLMTTPITVPGVGIFYTDKHMAKIAQDYISKYTTEDGMSKLLTGFDKIQSMWKRWVTGKGPNVIPYNARNLIDDNIRVIVGGGDITKLPGDYELAMDMFKYEDLINKVGKKEALKQIDQTRAANFLKSLGVDSKNPIDELWRRSIKNGVYSDVSKSVVEMDMGRPREVATALGREGKARPVEKIREKYDDILTINGKAQRREQATRMATYFNFWRKEGVESAGIDAVQNISFNYNELSKAEREVFKRIIPFYGFVKNNIKFYMDLIKDNPEKLARYYNVYEGLQSGSQSKFGEDWEAMPDYVKDTLSIPFKKEGDELRYLSGINLGIEGLGDIPIDQPGLGRAAGNLSPVLNMLMELTTGKDLFRNEDIMEVNQGYNYENRSELLKKLMNYQKYPVELDNGTTYEKETVSPEARYFLENVPFVSTLNTGARRLADLMDKERVLEALTNMIFPGRISEGRVDDARSRIERKQEEDLYRLLQKKGIADVYKSFYIPEGLREQLLK